MKEFIANNFTKYKSGYECFDRFVFLGFIDTTETPIVFYPSFIMRCSIKSMDPIIEFMKKIKGEEMKKSTLQKRIEKLEARLNKLLQKLSTKGLEEKTPDRLTAMEYLKGIPGSDKTATEVNAEHAILRILLEAGY